MQQIGIYEQLMTQMLASALNEEVFYVEKRSLNKEEASLYLSKYLSTILQHVFESFEGEDEERLFKQIELANQLLHWLKDAVVKNKELFEKNLIHSQGKILRALYRLENPVASDLKSYVQTIYPYTGLTQSALFCGGNTEEIRFDAELKREILSSNKISWLVSFIKWSGIRTLKSELEAFTRAGGELRIITTTYMGASDARAIEYLSQLPNTQIKISYDTQRERLHAKSYLFQRHTKFDTAYIGSSNLSYAALTQGLEWNLKITAQETPQVFDKSCKMFEAYWLSDDFSVFDAKNDADCLKLKQALRQEREFNQTGIQHFVDVTPYPHQNEILECLSVERELHQRFRNLVVAATGTGKTLISAFDFERFLKQNPRANFLFIAHREEILKQAQASYRNVLRSTDFGELWVGGSTPEHYHHVFASIQTFNNQFAHAKLGVHYYDYIVIDEVHHIAASSYRQVLNYFKPKILLGLTATPERQDGANILDDFGGVIAAEIRLPEAINRGHLVPFQYFCVDDDTDLRQVQWSRGRYDIAALSNLYTKNQLRVNKIVSSMLDLITDTTQMRALAFCVSVEHAKYMCAQFLLKGFAADVLSSENSHQRGEKQAALRRGDINILCVIDIFNEGVDIPEVDTLLFLRPTESLTIFLQQFGRGLRHAKNKQCCTILDFVGNANPDYDFSSKFRALVGSSGHSIKEEVQEGFPRVPFGCNIHLSKVASSIILKNIKNAILNEKKILRLIQDFVSASSLPLSLSNFLKIYEQVTLDILYKKPSNPSGWYHLSQIAFSTPKISSAAHLAHAGVTRAVKSRWLACDCVTYFNFIQKLCRNNFVLTPEMNERMALMLHYDVWQSDTDKARFASLAESLQALNHESVIQEMLELLSLLIDRVHHRQIALLSMDKNPLRLHARYTREQILLGFGEGSFTKKPSGREGVYIIKNPAQKILFVTLNKEGKQFSQSTMYHDYAINQDLFHWQSQNASRDNRGVGLSYVEHRKNKERIFLFVREQVKDEFGQTMGFVNFGEVEYVSHTGNQPMSIIWKLKNSLPNFMWKSVAKLAVA